MPSKFQGATSPSLGRDLARGSLWILQPSEVKFLKHEDPRAWSLTDLYNAGAIYKATCTESLWG